MMQILRETAESTNRALIAIGWDGHKALFGANIDNRSVGMDHFLDDLLEMSFESIDIVLNL